MHLSDRATARPRLAWLLSLRVLAVPPPPRSAELGGAQGGPRRPVRVLLVEDDPAIADMYRLQLRTDGYEVSAAVNSETALDSVATDRPDLVLLDVLLPGRDGFEILEEIRSRWPDLPVVILSNYGEPRLMARGRNLGARDYLVKSRVTPPEISRAIPGWLAPPER